MKTMRTVTMVCWIITAILLVGLTAWFAFGVAIGNGTVAAHTGWSFGFGWETLSGPYEVAGVYDIPADNIDSLRINWVAGDIRVGIYEGGDIIVTERAQRPLEENENLRFSISGGILSIEFRQGSNAHRMPQKQLDVLIPGSLGARLDRFMVNTTSGRVEASGFYAASIDINSVSGSINLSEISSQILDIDSTSGTIRLTSAAADEIDAGSISGAISISGVSSDTMSISSTSGSMDISGVFGDVALRSVSGSISVDNTAENSSVSANSVSGRINLSGSFDSARLSSTSGTVTIRSAVVPSALRVNTTSGGINVIVPDEGVVSVRHSSASRGFSSDISRGFSSDIPVLIQGDGAQFDFSSISGSIRITALH